MEEGVPLRALHLEQGIGRIFCIKPAESSLMSPRKRVVGAAGPFDLFFFVDLLYLYCIRRIYGKRF